MSEGPEAAIGYGRAEGCWADHRRYFSPRRCLSELKTLASRSHTTVVVEVPGLPMFNLPDVHGLFDDEDIQVNCHADATVAGHIKTFMPPRHISMLRELQTHIEAPELGPCVSADMDQHFKGVSSKSTCDFSISWIPFTQVSEDVDEGMRFPPQTERLHKQLLMELERQRIVSSNLEKFQIRKYRCPVQDESSQRLKKVCRSRLALARLHIHLRDHKILHVHEESVLQGHPAFSKARCPTTVPVVDLTADDSSATEPECTSFDAPGRDSKTDLQTTSIAATVSPDTNNLTSEADIQSSYFEDAFRAVIEEQHTPWLPKPLVPTEYVPGHAPIPDIDVDESHSGPHLASPLKMFSNSPHRKNIDIPLITVDGRENAKLPWTPIPAKFDHPVLDEELRMPANSGFAADSPQLQRIPPLKPAILQIRHEEPIRESPREGFSRSTMSLHENGLSALGFSAADGTSKTSLPSSLADIGKFMPIDDSISLLPKSNDTTATSKLIAGFMELRKAKRQRK